VKYCVLILKADTKSKNTGAKKKGKEDSNETSEESDSDEAEDDSSEEEETDSSEPSSDDKKKPPVKKVPTKTANDVKPTPEPTPKSNLDLLLELDDGKLCMHVKRRLCFCVTV
jgi:hypothetical protein